MAGRVKAGLEVKGLSRLEKEQATGAGILMPVPERQVRLSGGVIPIDDKSEGFPPEFFKGLVPEEINGTEAWRTTLRTDDDSGDMLFYNADGDAFWSVAADAAVWSADWIALLHSLDGKAGNFYDTGQVLRTLSEKQTPISRRSRRQSRTRILTGTGWATPQNFSCMEPTHSWPIQTPMACPTLRRRPMRTPTITTENDPVSLPPLPGSIGSAR